MWTGPLTAMLPDDLTTVITPETRRRLDSLPEFTWAFAFESGDEDGVPLIRTISFKRRPSKAQRMRRMRWLYARRRR